MPDLEAEPFDPERDAGLHALDDEHGSEMLKARKTWTRHGSLLWTNDPLIVE